MNGSRDGYIVIVRDGASGREIQRPQFPSKSESDNYAALLSALGYATEAQRIAAR